MSNVAWPKWKIYEIFYNVYLNESEAKNLGKNWMKFVVIDGMEKQSR
jgi:hypothetical protein